MNNSLEEEREEEGDEEQMVRSDVALSSSVCSQEENRVLVTIQTEYGAIQVPITCESETTLEDVGKQVWSGSVLMCEYALRHKVCLNA